MNLLKFSSKNLRNRIRLKEPTYLKRTNMRTFHVRGRSANLLLMSDIIRIYSDSLYILGMISLD